MQELNLLLYIVIISLFQILVNLLFNYLIEKSVQPSNNHVGSKDNKTFSLILSILNCICFLYSLYYLLGFIKMFLLPEFLEIFLSFQPLT